MKSLIISLTALLVSLAVTCFAGNVKPKVDRGTGVIGTITNGEVLVDSHGHAYSTGGVSVVSWGMIVGAISNQIDLWTYLTIGSNSWVWIMDNSNHIYYLYSKTGLWNQSAIDSSYTTNWIATNGSLYAISVLQNRTQRWDEAYVFINNNSNGLKYLMSRSNLWDEVYAYINGNSNGLDYVLSQTNRWNASITNEALWIAWATMDRTNGIDYMLIRTSVWDGVSIYINSNSNGLDYVLGRTNRWDASITNGQSGLDVSSPSAFTNSVNAVITNRVLYFTVDTTSSNYTVSLPDPYGTAYVYYKPIALNSLLISYGSSTSTVAGIAVAKCYPVSSTNWIVEW